NRLAGRQFRAATEARAESSLFGGRRALIEGAPVPHGTLCRTHRAAIDSRSGYAYKEEAVESRIAGGERFEADVVAKVHAVIIAADLRSVSPFSDMEANLFPGYGCLTL